MQAKFWKSALLLAAFTLSASICGAEDIPAKPKPFPDFSAKRQKPPASGTRKRITVQITPNGPKAGAIVGANKPAGAGASSGPSHHEWFWSVISPKIEDSKPGRVQKALVRISKPPQGEGVPAPRLQTLYGIAQAQGIEILKSTIGTKVSPAFVLAVIAVESAGQVDAGSSAGAQGLMQLMPATAARFGVTDSFNAAQNIKGGVAYLDWLMGQFDNDPILVLAAYNAGENAVRKNGGVPPYKETRGYVPKVLAAYSVARNLCKTPPQLVTDGCVFKKLGS